MTSLELCKKFKVCIIDIGNKLSQRKCLIDESKPCNKLCNPCNIVTGFGGCQFLDGTKLTFYPAGSGLLKFINKNNINNYYEYVKKVLLKYGLPNIICKEKSEVKKIKEQFDSIGLDLKYYNSQKVDRFTMNKIGININKELIKNKVEFYYNETILNIKKNIDFEIKLKNNNIIHAKKIVFATGRYGVTYLDNISKVLGIKQIKNNYITEIGVRVEMPSKTLKNIGKYFNDIKIKKIIDNNNEIRTFCQNYQGIVRKCVLDRYNDKIISLDGCIMNDNYNNSANIAIHHRFNKKIIDNEYLKIDKPIVQNMESFLNNNNNNLEINNTYCTMNDYKIGNINNYLPHDTLSYIKQMIIDIDKVIPGFANKNNIVYGPSFELGFKKYNLSNNFETNIDGIYIGGDATGYFRGVMQAMVSGKVISDDIKRKLGCKNEK